MAVSNPGGGGGGVVTALGTPGVDNTITVNNGVGSQNSAILLDGSNHCTISAQNDRGRLGGLNMQCVQWDGFNSQLGFFGTAPASKPTVTGSKGANAALTSLMTALAALGLVVDSTT